MANRIIITDGDWSGDTVRLVPRSDLPLIESVTAGQWLLSNTATSPTPITVSDPVAAPASPDEAVNAAIMQHSPQFLLSDISGSQWNDLSGNGRHATIVGTQGARVSTGPAGMPFFMGTTTCHAEIAHNEAFNSAARTILFWVNPTSNINISGVYRGSVEKLSRLNPVESTVRPQSYWNDSGHLLDGGAGFSTPYQEWVLWAGTFEPGVGSKIYVGHSSHGFVLAGSNSSTSLGNSTIDLTINGRKSGTGTMERRTDWGFSKVARFASALTQSQIAAIYNASIGA